MRKRFTRAIYAVSAAALVSTSLSLGAGAASAATTSHNGTYQCGNTCINVFSLRLGSSVTNNAYVPGDTGAGGRVGTMVNLHLAGNTRPNGDFSLSGTGSVSDWCGTFWPNYSYICRHYGSDSVFEVQFSPFGQPFGTLCAGLQYPVYSGENVTLQPCGMRSSTLWIADDNHQVGGNGPFSLTSNDCADPVSGLHMPVGPGDTSVPYCPWLNGASHNMFSHPLALTVDTGTQRPTDQLKAMSLALVPGFFGPQPVDSQLFAYFLGTVNS